MKDLNEFLIILGFTSLGEVLQRVVPLPIPASVYGLVLLFMALYLKIVKPEQVKTTGSFLSGLLPLLFVSPTVRIIEHWELIAPNLVPIVVLLVSTTVLTFGISGKLTQLVMKKGGGNHA
jgi:holin-like protein